MVKVERISLEKDGLKKFFSDNEVRIIEALWDERGLTSSKIQELCPDMSLACVAGTLDRLVKSGYVTREIDTNGRGIRYLYYPSADRKMTGIRISERVIEVLVNTFGTSAVASLGKQRRKRGRAK